MLRCTFTAGLLKQNERTILLKIRYPQKEPVERSAHFCEHGRRNGIYAEIRFEHFNTFADYVYPVYFCIVKFIINT